MCCYARELLTRRLRGPYTDQLTGPLRGPYTDQNARRFARAALVPEELLARASATRLVPSAIRIHGFKHPAAALHQGEEAAVHVSADLGVGSHSNDDRTDRVPAGTASNVHRASADAPSRPMDARSLPPDDGLAGIPGRR